MPVLIHCSVMHTGKVLVVAGSRTTDERISRRNLGSGTGSCRQDLLWDVFCNSMAALPDGRWVIVGGNEQYDPFTVSIGRPCLIRRRRNSMSSSMAHGRWYATVTELADGS
jgi:hypothetical protein